MMNTLSKEENIQYSRQIKLAEIGLIGQQKIKDAKVLVVGAGGLGCPVLQYLNGAGVGTIGIIDFDKVEIHNLHRQILFDRADVGKQKAIAAAEKLKKQNPETQILTFNERLNKSNCSSILQSFDIIVDGSDNFSTRYLINDTCVALDKPLVYGSILGFEGQVAVFNLKGSKNLRDLFPEPPDPKDIPGCEDNGVLATLPAIIGSMMAHETLKIIIDHSPLQNTFIDFDTTELRFSKISIQ